MSDAPRLHVADPLTADCSITLDPARAHYLGTVMRLRSGDAVRLFNARDGEWSGRIDAVGRGRVTVAIEAQVLAPRPEPGPALLFALLKRDATDLVVQKATELGASALYPLITERTNAARVNEARLQAIATEAAEQSERLTVPSIHPPAKLFHVLGEWPSDWPIFAAIERGAYPVPRSVRGASALLVGPEGGFTPGELDGLGRCPIVTKVSLGPRILRAETACLAGLTLLQGPGCG